MGRERGRQGEGKKRRGGKGGREGREGREGTPVCIFKFSLE